MTADIKHTTCGQCGREIAASEIVVDEETGMLLCPVCSLERESCGCGDVGD